MRTLIATIILSLGLITSAFAAGSSTRIHIDHDGCSGFGKIEDIDIEFEDGWIFIETCEKDPTVFVITDDYDLEIDGVRIKLNEDQKKVVERFYKRYAELNIEAAKIGIEAAEIGLVGAKIGVKAVSSLWKFILPGYDSDDFEREIEAEAEAIEAKAEKLEAKAEVIEKIAEDTEDAYWQMLYAIPQLEKLESL